MERKVSSNLVTQWVQLVKQEFAQFLLRDVQKEALIGFTISTIALPLSMAYALSVGLNPTVGLVTAILGGIFVGIMGGTSFQISGATAVMAASLIPFVSQYGAEAMLAGGLIAGIILIVVGFLGIGNLSNYFPLPVVTGFSSGISVLIIFSQIDVVLGIKADTGSSVLDKIKAYLQFSNLSIGWQEIVLAVMTVLIVIGIRKFEGGIRNLSFLLGILVATVFVQVMNWPVDLIGEIPNTIILDERLTLTSLASINWFQYIGAALTITALILIEVLLANASGERQTKKTPNNNVEMVGLGLANMLTPFFGGMPISAAISRSNVNIAAGGKTRLVPIFQGLFLLLMVLVLYRLIGQIPLASLGGILVLTAVWMNDLESINFFFKSKDIMALFVFLLTLGIMVFVSLIAGVIAGILVQTLWHVVSSKAEKKFQLVTEQTSKDSWVLTGDLFFGTARAFHNQIEAESADITNMQLDFTNVTHLDATGIETLLQIGDAQLKKGGAFNVVGNEKVSNLIDTFLPI